MGWIGVACSSDGTKLVAVAYDNGIYTSTNSGATWVSNSVPNEQWFSVASSADGTKLVAVGNGGIFTSQSTFLPFLNITQLSCNIVLSWTVPSTDFVLQQNSGLTSANWTDVTNTPILNPTNLQDEVTIPISGAQQFYRLIN